MHLQDLTNAFDALLRERRFTDAAALCDSALAERTTPQERCRILQLKAEAMVADGRQAPALGLLKDAMGLTRPYSDSRARLLTSLSAAYAGAVCLPECIRMRDEFMHIRTENPTPTVRRMHPHVEYNLALVYHELDNIDKAEDHYIWAEAACGRMKDPLTEGLRQKIKFNLIDVFLENDREEKAYDLMFHLFPRLDATVYGAHMDNRRALHALYTGDLGSAVLWIMSGLAHPSCDPRSRAALHLTKAKIAYASGSLREAQECAEQAQALAMAANSNRLVSRAIRFLERVPKGV